MMFCSRCGVRLQPGAGYCIDCGAPVRSNAVLPPGVAPTDATAPSAANPGTRGPSRRVVAALAVAIVGAAGYVYATPYLALQAYGDAFDRQAFAELAPAVDAPALTSSIKAMLADARARVEAQDREAGIQPGQSDQGALIGLLGGNADQIVDTLVTEALKPESLAKLQLALASGKRIQDRMSARHFEDAEAAFRRIRDEIVIRTGYVGLSRFRVSARHHTLGAVHLVFDRHGLVQWRLTAVQSDDTLPLLMRQVGLAAPVSDLVSKAIALGRWGVARSWLGVALQLDQPDSRHRLAMLTMASTPGHAADPETAYRLLKQGVAARDAKSALVLGALLEAGLGMDKADLIGAIEAYTHAHEFGAKGLEYKLFVLNHVASPATPARMMAAGRWLQLWAASWSARSGRLDPSAVGRFAAGLMNEGGIPAAQAGPPPWVTPLRDAAADGTGVGPLVFGMQVGEVRAILGPPDHAVVTGDGQRESLLYFARPPHPTLALTFRFDGVRRFSGPRRVLNTIGFMARTAPGAKPGIGAVEDVLGEPQDGTVQQVGAGASAWSLRTPLCRWGVADLTDPDKLYKPTSDALSRMIDRDDIGARIQVCRSDGRAVAVTFNNRD